jgi:ATP-binding protein involved in chromosome partitioning
MSKKQAVVKPETVMEALSKVLDPELNKDLVSLGMIKDLTVEGSKVSLRVELTTPACPLREKIERDVREAVLSVKGVEEADVQMDSRVPRGSMGPKNLNPDLHNVIAIASGKGGVGKTTVAVNIAVALARSGACVGLLDADIYGPNVPTMLGLDQLPPAREKKLMPAEVHGVKVMSIAFLVQPGQPLIWRGPMLHSVIQQFISDVDWGELDYLIVDLPPGTGDAPLSLAQSVPLVGAVIVTIPAKVSIDDARRGLEMFRSIQVPILGVVENMSFLEMPDGSQVDVFGKGGGEKLADEAGVPFLGSIPLDPHVRQAGDGGVPAIIAHPESGVSEALTSVAEQIAAKVSMRVLLQDDGGVKTAG